MPIAATARGANVGNFRDRPPTKSAYAPTRDAAGRARARGLPHQRSKLKGKPLFTPLRAAPRSMAAAVRRRGIAAREDEAVAVCDICEPKRIPAYNLR